MKKISLILFIVAVMIVGCKGKSDLTSHINPITNIKQDLYGERLYDYDSPYTIGYKNQDNTYSLYIYESPIQFKTPNGYELIDNAIVKSKFQNFAFENKSNNIKTYFPMTLNENFRIQREGEFMEFRVDDDVSDFSKAKAITYTNMYGDQVIAVSYISNDKEWFFYPTKAGIKAEIVLKSIPPKNEINFIVNSSAIRFENLHNGYIRFLKKDSGEETEMNAGIIYKPLLKYHFDNKEAIDTLSEMKFYKKADQYILKIQMNTEVINNKKLEFPIRLDPSFELHQNKTPDSTIYSKFYTNNFLSNYAVVGKHPFFGEGWHYTRMYINKYIYIKCNDIISADFHIKNLYSNSENTIVLQISSVDKEWSSGQMVWKTKVQPLKHTVSSQINSEYIFNITDFVKRVVTDGTGNTEINGNVIQKIDEKQGYSVIATSDNSAYTPYIHLKFSK